MAITYTLTPTSMLVAADQSGQQNVVLRVNWTYSATDGIYTAKNPAGFTYFTYTAGSPFTPYQSLTEAQVANWVLGSWTPDQTQANQKPLADNIAAQKAAQYSVPPLPWQS